MRLDKKEYKQAVGCLLRYNYNCMNIINIRADIMGVSIPENDGMPKAPYSISDSVYNQYIRLQEDKELQRSLKEYKAVMLALELVDDVSKGIFEEEFRKSKKKWQVINELSISERTYERRKKALIYTVYKEIKKLAENWRNLIKKPC